MKLKITKKIQIEAKTIRIYMKVRDEFFCQILDNELQELVEYEGYVPTFMPHNVTGESGGNHYGDYLILDIEIDTGKITNWVAPTAEVIEDFINKKGNENEN